MKQTFPFIVVLLLTAVVSASLIENVTIEQMTREADHVIIGTVQNKVSRWEGDQIVTDIEMVVVEPETWAMLPVAFYFFRGLPDPGVLQS